VSATSSRLRLKCDLARAGESAQRVRAGRAGHRSRGLAFHGKPLGDHEIDPLRRDVHVREGKSGIGISNLPHDDGRRIERRQSGTERGNDALDAGKSELDTLRVASAERDATDRRLDGQ
jgi:hypothetical protein